VIRGVRSARTIRGMGRLGVLAGVCVLALGFSGGALAGVARHAVATKVTVTFTDTSLAISRGGLQAGAATFVVVNKSSKPHILLIVGPGVNQVRTPKLMTGRSATLTLKLRTGAYILSDPIGKSNPHWIVVSPASIVHATGTGTTGTGSQMTDPGMNCD